MFFLCLTIIIIFLISTIAILYTSIEIEIKKLKISTEKKQGKYLDKESKVIVKINIFDKIEIIKIDITKLGKTKGKIENLQKKIKESKNKIDIKLFKSLKYSEIKEFRLKVQIGVEDAAINAILVGIVSTIISIVLRKTIEEAKENYWEVIPIYQNKNIINIEFDGTFKVKVIHIIKEIYKSKKEMIENQKATIKKEKVMV